jgi:hypothetical protein
MRKCEVINLPKVVPYPLVVVIIAIAKEICRYKRSEIRKVRNQGYLDQAAERGE